MPDAPGRSVVVSQPTGQSAYQIAVSHGFSGTEQEWLNSLYGIAGTAGAGLVNRGDWVSGRTYLPNHYVFDDGSVSGESIWVLRSTTPLVSTTAPASDLTNWLEWIPDVVSATGVALTRSNDTNVTLTLGGSPTTALIHAASITAGWSGQLSLARGGTAANLSDPGDDTLMGWDDTDNSMAFLTIGTGLSYDHSTHTISSTGGGGGTWGSITGTLSAQTDLQSALDDKVPTTRTVNGHDLSSNVTVTPTDLSLVIGTNVEAWSANLDAWSALATSAKVTANGAITGATKTKITYDTKGLVTAGADATTADISDSSNKRYVTDAELVVIGNTSGANTGDQIVPVNTTSTASQWFSAYTAATGVFTKSQPSFSDIASTPTTLSGYGISDAQPLDSDLTTIAGLTATTDNFIVSVSSAWASRTPSQARTTLGLVIGTNVQAWDTQLDSLAGLSYSGNALKSIRVNAGETAFELATISASTAWGAITGTLSDQTDLQSALDAKQPLDSDLTTIAGLTATTDNFLVSVSSAWASRTPSQVRSTLGLVIGTNVQAWDADLDSWAGVTRASGFDTFVATPSSANLLSLVTDETGSGGALVFATGPTLSNPIVGTQSAADNSTKAASTAYADAKVSDTAFAGSWNAVTGIAPSKNTVYDTLTTGYKQSGASSTSGTPGTTLGSITAAANNQLVNFSVVCYQSNTANTQMTVTITYADSTTTTDTTSAANAAYFNVNYGGILKTAATPTFTALAAKQVTSIAVVTAGTGTGTRGATLSAWEIPQ